MLYKPHAPIAADKDIASCNESFFWGLLEVWNERRTREWQAKTAAEKLLLPLADYLLQEADWNAYPRAIIAPKGSTRAGIPAAAIYSKEGSDYVDVALDDRVALTSFFTLDSEVDNQGKAAGAWIVACNLATIYPESAQNADENLRRDVMGYINHSAGYGLYFGQGIVSGVRDALPEISGTFKDDLALKDGYPWCTIRVPFTMLVNYYFN